MIKANVIIEDKSWFKFIKNPKNFLDKKTKKIEKDKFFIKNKKYYFNLFLSNSKKIKKLNKKFRNKNKSTDILSFPFYNYEDMKKSIKLNEDIYLGDIILNIKKLERDKGVKKFKSHFDILWIHGLLHLFGYRHKKNSDFKKMILIENKFYRKVNLNV